MALVVAHVGFSLRFGGKAQNELKFMEYVFAGGDANLSQFMNRYINTSTIPLNSMTLN
jgi:hypothetical protein